ncbi:uncharacterized protein LOC131254715 isoform X2 [Magnolia sinica]|uniref:uncharacterized protein LOC131254715 isoform X2 n=1 Tax=Magnolia sinica TaxID=86752 RepID=UPI00265AAB6D|nr:uncharacterized protein LOC131254715 isoform X2 [Magnolia sinica]
MRSGKGLKIMNFGASQQQTNGVEDALQAADDDVVDPHLERIKNKAVVRKAMKRMKILLWRRMMEALLLMILETKNQMLVKMVMTKKSLSRRKLRKKQLLLRHLLLRGNPRMEMKMVQRRENQRRKRILVHQRELCLLSCSSQKLKEMCFYYIPPHM